MAKYIANIAGQLTEVRGQVTTAGAGDANKIIETNAQGVLDATMLPPGVGANTVAIITSEALSAGDWVNIYNNAGATNCRRADNNVGKEVWGFVLGSFASAASATVYLAGLNNQVTGQTLGAKIYLSGTPGAGSATPTVAAAGKIHQVIGKAITATSVAFDYVEPVSLVV